MPRRPRVVVPGVPLHVIQRGNNRSACFYRDDDYRLYLDHLATEAVEHGCLIHAYCLMTNHVHLLLTPNEARSVGRLMKSVGQRYVQYINRTYQRTGTLWEGRFRSCLVSDDVYVLACYRYIELNPIRAGMVRHPADYPWSSYRVNGQAFDETPLSPHDTYTRLGSDGDERAAAYRALFHQDLCPSLMAEIRHATNGNFCLGGPRFAEEVATMLGRRVVPGVPGRPRKSEAAGSALT